MKIENTWSYEIEPPVEVEIVLTGRRSSQSRWASVSSMHKNDPEHKRSGFSYLAALGLNSRKNLPGISNTKMMPSTMAMMTLMAVNPLDMAWSNWLVTR